MLYPKIERKSLALVLIFLVLTLATVGIMFLIYFFYTENNLIFVKQLRNNMYSSSNLKINSNSETYHHRQYSNHKQSLLPERDHLQRESDSTKNSNNYYSRLIKPIKASKTVSNGQNQSFASLSPDDSEQPRRDLQRYNPPRFNGYDDVTHEIEASDETYSSSNFYANSDAIYIDDYDRPIDVNVKADQRDINKIDYFETVIMDHKGGQQKMSLNRKRGGGGVGGGAGAGRKPSTRAQQRTKSLPLEINGAAPSPPSATMNEYLIIYTKKSKHRKQWKPPQKPNRLDNSSDEFLDNDTIGSGSGDFVDEEDDEGNDDDGGSTARLASARRSNRPNISVQGSDRDTEKYRIENRSENLYSVSSELVSNLSNRTGSNSTGNLSVDPSTSRPSSISPIVLNNNKKWIPPSIVSSREQLLITTTSITGLNSQHIVPVIASIAGHQQPEQLASHNQNSGAWLETRARRIMGNVKKSEERSRQLLLCAEAGGGELCRMLFKGHLNE